MTQEVLHGNDANVAKAYSLMAINGQTAVWTRFASQEIDVLLNEVNLTPGSQVIDLGCGIGRHSLQLAKRGFHVRAFDFVDSWVERVQQLAIDHDDEIEDAGGSLKAEWADARNAPAISAGKLVLCLYDVLGSSDSLADAERICDGLFRLCSPGGHVAIGCLNGVQMLQGLPVSRMVCGEPEKSELEPLNAMQHSGEIFEFSKMRYDPQSGILYRREQFYEDKNLLFDTVLKERRFIPFQVVDLLLRAGFVEIRGGSVRAGRWDLRASFDPNAPELLFIASRPTDTLKSIPRYRPVVQQSMDHCGYSLELIPRKQITPHHAAIVSRIFCTSFGKSPKDGKMRVLGPERMWKRLLKSSYLCLACKADQPVGYMFGTEYKHLLTNIAWLDSICVVKECRRRGIATALIDLFARAVPQFKWLGATSPNPITWKVLEKAELGEVYGPGRPAPSAIIGSLEYIQNSCEDLRGCEIDRERMIVKTDFSVAIEAFQPSPGSLVESNGGVSLAEPAWWTSLANLPEDYESLLIIERSATHLLEGSG